MANFHYFESLSSTMDAARAHALTHAEEGTVIVAKHQTGGRGRRGRAWESLPGNLHLTYITYQDCPLLKTPQLSFVACVAIGEALRSFLPPGHALLYKWPNDLLLNGKKVGGILLETLPIPEKGEIACLIGCGINLVASPLEARYPATSFQDETLDVPYENALQKIGDSLEQHITLWKKEGFSPISKAWMTFAIGVGDPLSFEIEGDHLEGISQGIDEEGALLLETSQGLVKLRAGEIVRSF